jgi:hypothetical protein
MDTLDTCDALVEAIDVLHAQAAETDTASPGGSVIRAAIKTLEMIRDQRGCEHFDPANTSGKLTDLIDLIVFG